MRKTKKGREELKFINFCLSKNQMKEVLEKPNPGGSSPSPIKVNMKTLLTAEQKVLSQCTLFIAQLY